MKPEAKNICNLKPCRQISFAGFCLSLLFIFPLSISFQRIEDFTIVKSFFVYKSIYLSLYSQYMEFLSRHPILYF